MRIYVKYCGGCNSYYDRSKVVQNLKEEMPSHWVWDSSGSVENADMVLLVAGCKRKCNIKTISFHQELLVIDKMEDLIQVKNRLGEINRRENMDFNQYYKEHLKSAAEAVQYIKSGDRVVIGHAVGEPQSLVKAMVDRQEELQDVEIVHMVCLGKAQYCAPEAKGHFRHNAIFVGGPTRKAIEEGRGDFTPCFFYQVPSLLQDSLPVDIALIQVSKPDKNGFVSLGVSVDYTKAAAQNAKYVIAQVNEAMPRTMGESYLNVTDIDCFVEYTEPLLELQPSQLSEEEIQIGKYCAELIPDGATLQLGIGTLPDAVLMSLTEKKDLGIHSEMFSDGVMHLVKAGVINNSKKTLLQGRMVATFIMGSKELYDFINDNPMVYMAPVDYVNNPCIIGQNDKLISINSCVQVDLQGQVCAESVGLKQISGVGGQVDFIRGSSFSKEGKAILAITSTARNGEVSKIVPLLDKGAAVTTGRNDVDYIVTEYGIAKLKGKTLRERGRALIQIAHPKFRDELIKEWEDRFRTKF